MRKLELVSLPEGVFDPADMMKKGGEAVAEAIRAANANPEDEVAQHTAKFAEAHYRGTYTDKVSHLIGGIKYGAYHNEDKEFIRKGAASDICPRMIPPKEAPKSIEKPRIDTEAVAKTVNGRLRIGSDLYTIKDGDLKLDGKKVGKFQPGYVAEFDIANPNKPNEPLKKYVDLNRANRVLLDYNDGK